MKYLKTFEGMSEDNEWMIFAGLGGGFGGAQQMGIFTGTEDEANSEAWRMSVEEYEGMVGMHGLRDVDEIMEEDEVDADEAQEISNDERESWLDYWVEKYDPEKHQDTDDRLN
ncbi:MAG: hypothetical protein SLAVMIC_00216 [uncultured marine phage]|uniref:Uncharacterized protein n=1 Tax=uncultured marine phage TaxID=707152 RepID=A0A8D9CET2_9VIRU|nr:MAG: hypothetical protein SLAVMIC_00216 [uncultured marine phage]